MHTPGPWRIVKGHFPNDGAYDYGIFAEIDWKRHVIAEAFGRSDETTFHDSRANATLIAAAPDMYEALAEFENEYRGGEYDDELWPLMKKARAALAKARGKTINETASNDE